MMSPSVLRLDTHCLQTLNDDVTVRPDTDDEVILAF